MRDCCAINKPRLDTAEDGVMVQELLPVTGRPPLRASASAFPDSTGFALVGNLPWRHLALETAPVGKQKSISPVIF